MLILITCEEKLYFLYMVSIEGILKWQKSKMVHYTIQKKKSELVLELLKPPAENNNRKQKALCKWGLSEWLHPPYCIPAPPYGFN